MILRPGLKFALEAFYMQFLARAKFYLRACHINKNKPIVFRYDHFSHYLIETTSETKFRFALFDRNNRTRNWSVAIALFLLRSLFSSTNDNNNSEYSNQLNETSYWQAAIQCIFFHWLKIASSML